MELLRVLVMGLPGMVGEMIEAAVDAQPSLLLVHAPMETQPPQAIEQADPHVVVVGTDDASLLPAWLEALSVRAGLRVVAVDPVHGRGVLYEMRPHAVALGDVSPSDIVAAIQTPRCDPTQATEGPEY